MKHAQIKLAKIKNIIVTDPNTDLSLFMIDPTDGLPFDALVPIDNIFPAPQIGWLYDGQNFQDSNDAAIMNLTIEQDITFAGQMINHLEVDVAAAESVLNPPPPPPPPDPGGASGNVDPPGDLSPPLKA